jgi:protocatechuate 3,4-dioxygenase beta subunit
MNESSQQQVGGRCEGCEAIYESKMPFNALNEVDTLPIFNEPGPKLVVSGTVYKSDGKTPAPGVVLYVYHTDLVGKYRVVGNETGWAKRHGSIRGWMKTNVLGQYKFYTVRPASYSKTGPPAHIHITVKEPDKNEYWIDEFHFDDDPFLMAEERKRFQNRGGNGVLQLEEKDGIYYGERNIYLGKNVPGYPSEKNEGLQSGLAIGDNCPAFDPIHLSGADVNRSACPMCKYGYGQGVMVWFNHTSLDKLKRFAMLIEDEMKKRGEKSLRVFLVYMNPTYANNDAEEQRILREKIKKWCTEQSLQKVAMLWVPSPTDEETSGAFHLNPKANNTVFVYKKRKVAAKWVNIDYSDEAVKIILNEL